MLYVSNKHLFISFFVVLRRGGWEISIFRVIFIINPLRPIGSPVTHENIPTNWPNFTASPALFGWPAHNRHTAACIHRFSHILRWPPEPVVWFMSESRAVANEHEGYKWTLSIISSSFWMAVGLKGLTPKVSQNESQASAITMSVITILSLPSLNINRALHRSTAELSKCENKKRKFVRHSFTMTSIRFSRIHVIVIIPASISPCIHNCTSWLVSQQQGRFNWWPSQRNWGLKIEISSGVI